MRSHEGGCTAICVSVRESCCVLASVRRVFAAAGGAIATRRSISRHRPDSTPLQSSILCVSTLGCNHRITECACSLAEGSRVRVCVLLSMTFFVFFRISLRLLFDGKTTHTRTRIHSDTQKKHQPPYIMHSTIGERERTRAVTLPATRRRSDCSTGVCVPHQNRGIGSTDYNICLGRCYYLFRFSLLNYQHF